jgi:hypothetical protein
MGGINGMRQYIDYFGLNITGDTKTSIVFGVYTMYVKPFIYLLAQ